MKKVVKHSIRYEITTMVLGVPVLTVVLCGAVTAFGMQNTVREAATASQSLGETAAYDNRTVLVGQVRSGLKKQVERKAELTEERLLNIAGQVETTAGYISGAYQNPQRYLPRPVEKPAMRNAGKWVLQHSLVEDMDYEAVQEEIDLTGNLYHMIAPLCEGNDTVGSICFSPANGFMVSYSRNSDNMFEGKTTGQSAELFMDHYDPRDRDWYQEAVEIGESVFTETYLDTFGRLLISRVAPVYGRGAKPVGILATDILIKDASHSVASTRMGNRGYVSLMSHNRYVVSTPDLAVVDGIYESVNLVKQEEMETSTERMASGQSGLISLVKDGEGVFTAFELIAPTGWSVAVTFPQEEVIAPAAMSHENILENTGRANAQVERIVHSAMVGTLALSALALPEVLLFAGIRSRRITEPITRLTREVAIIRQRNLDHTVEMHTGDELETLRSAFNQMTRSLDEYIENLAEVTMDREKTATELNVASTIWSSILLCTLPTFSDQKDFDTYVDTRPAKAVGGDFYDSFKTDKGYPWVVIAGVSGKGVPAALFMVTAKTMLKNHAGFDASPAGVLTTVSDRLCENNEADIFVIMSIGVFEISSNIFTFSNTSHNHPLLYRGGGTFDWLESSPGFAIAGMKGTEFRDSRVTISPGDYLFLYMDGVTETLNRKEELYGDDRLIEMLSRLEIREVSVDELVTCMKANLTSYADGAEQADDIIMLVLRIREEER